MHIGNLPKKAACEPRLHLNLDTTRRHNERLRRLYPDGTPAGTGHRDRRRSGASTIRCIGARPISPKLAISARCLTCSGLSSRSVELSNPGILPTREGGSILYYHFDYELGARDMQDTMAFLRTHPAMNGKGGLGWLYRRQDVLLDVLPLRHRLRGCLLLAPISSTRSARRRTCIGHSFFCYVFIVDKWVQPEVNDFIEANDQNQRTLWLQLKNTLGPRTPSPAAAYVPIQARGRQGAENSSTSSLKHLR